MSFGLVMARGYRDACAMPVADPGEADHERRLSFPPSGEVSFTASKQ
jgi:hypothetical protein